MEVIVWIIVFFILNTFAYVYLLGMDYIEKKQQSKLKELKKYKFLFVRFKKEENLKNFIGLKSFALQIFHLILTVILFLLIILNLFIINNKLVFIGCSIILGLYFVYCLILMLRVLRITESLKSKKIYK